MIIIVHRAVQDIGHVAVGVLDGAGEVEDHFGASGFAGAGGAGLACDLDLAAD